MRCFYGNRVKRDSFKHFFSAPYMKHPCKLYSNLFHCQIIKKCGFHSSFNRVILRQRRPSVHTTLTTDISFHSFIHVPLHWGFFSLVSQSVLSPQTHRSCSVQLWSTGFGLHVHHRERPCMLHLSQACKDEASCTRSAGLRLRSVQQAVCCTIQAHQLKSTELSSMMRGQTQHRHSSRQQASRTVPLPCSDSTQDPFPWSESRASEFDMFILNGRHN